MEKILQQILEGQTKLVEEIQDIKATQSQELKGIKEQLNNMQGQLAENTRFINALSQDVARTATKEDLAKIYSRIEVLSIHFMNQEAEIRELKLAK